MFSFTLPKVIFLVALIPLLGSPIYSRVVPSSGQLALFATEPLNTLDRRQNGNLNVAGELYGIGLRVGAYLQIFGMFLSCLGSEKRSRNGVKLLSSSVCLSLYTAWSILVISHRSISPCEAWIILSITAAYATPQNAALTDPGVKMNGGFAILLCAISVIWQEILILLFFATFYRQLPLLGTENLVWFFAPVDIGGWFRIFMLIVSSVQCLFLPFEMIGYLDMLSRRFDAWAGIDRNNQSNISRLDGAESSKRWRVLLQPGANFLSRFCNMSCIKLMRQLSDKLISWIVGVNSKLDKQTSEEREKVRRFGTICRQLYCLWGLVFLILTIAGVEMTINYNSLSPVTNLTLPGQIIPFMLGIITVIEGASTAGKPKSQRTILGGRIDLDDLLSMEDLSNVPGQSDTREEDAAEVEQPKNESLSLEANY